MVFLTGLLGEGLGPTLPAAVGVREAGVVCLSTVASSAWPKQSADAPDEAREWMSVSAMEELVVMLSSRPPVPSLLILTPSEDVVAMLDSWFAVVLLPLRGLDRL
jgi:hypothetical protein